MGKNVQEEDDSMTIEQYLEKDLKKKGFRQSFASPGGL